MTGGDGGFTDRGELGVPLAVRRREALEIVVAGDHELARDEVAGRIGTTLGEPPTQGVELVGVEVVCGEDLGGLGLQLVAGDQLFCGERTAHGADDATPGTASVGWPDVHCSSLHSSAA